jgi:hypothetical protein
MESGLTDPLVLYGFRTDYSAVLLAPKFLQLQMGAIGY